MGEEKATRERLLDSARKEFLEKGYMKASLRTICKNAGVTTGALYFFFQDKEDLLRNLVEEPLNELVALIKGHLSQELEAQSPYVSTEADSIDIQAAKDIVHFLYRYHEAFLILLTKSQGSVYEDIVSRFADWIEAHYQIVADKSAGMCGAPKMERYIINWMAHMQMNAFIHLLVHEPDEDKAVRYIEKIVVFLLSGWNGLLGGAMK